MLTILHQQNQVILVNCKTKTAFTDSDKLYIQINCDFTIVLVSVIRCHPAKYFAVCDQTYF